MTKAIYTTCDISVSIEVPTDDMPLWEALDNVIRPLLLAAGYSPALVERLVLDTSPDPS